MTVNFQFIYNPLKTVPQLPNSGVEEVTRQPAEPRENKLHIENQNFKNRQYEKYKK